MEKSRKRRVSDEFFDATDSKKIKEDVKENIEDADSNDSFDNFCPSIVRKGSPEKISPRSRSNRILVDEDSFDTPVSENKPILKKKESGVPNFPCLFDDSIVFYLTVKNVERREEGCLDLECVDKNGKSRVVYLQDRWSEVEIHPGNSINLISPQIWGNDDFILNDEHGILILNPNALISCTSVSSANFCARKTILNEKFKFGNASNKAMLLGIIMHEIFQTAITSKKRPLTDKDLLKIWSSQSPKYAEELVALSYTPSCLDAELQPYFSVICDWINKHYPNSNSIFSKKPNPLPSKSEILEIHDIEENIWDPKLGLKGKIDVSIKTKMGKGMESLELKTGKSSFSSEHIGQVLLYCMMQSSRHDQPIGAGNILYLKDGAQKSVNPRAAELFGILQLRNNLSPFFEDPTTNQLPNSRADTRFCEKCDHKVMCTFNQKTEEKYEKSSETMKSFAENEMKHLENSHIEYTQNWIRWISSEWKCEKEKMETKNENLWLKSIGNRIEEGICIGNLYPISEEMSNSSRILINFSRKDSKNSNNFSNGDVCLLSNRKNIAIAFAVIDEVSENFLRISSDKRILSKNLEAPFHLDRYTSASTHSTTLGNLVYFLQNDDVGLRLRNILVDLSPPRPFSMIDLSPAVKKLIIRAKLNNEQRLAVVNSLSTDDFMMIEGFPGSGKTTLISVLIQCLIATGKNVLLAAFTHSAVDNILGKLMKEVSNEKILRLGSSSSIKDEIRKLTLKSKLENEKSEDYYAAVKKTMKTTPIVACTCHHVPRELLFSYRHFDVVIVDEASMVLEPLLIPVLATSNKFVLVGDCKQLKPLVISKKAKFEGAGISTMEKLQKAHPNSVVSLNSQYRMNRKISDISSKLFYENRLICGNESVARSSLDKSGDYRILENAEEKLSKILSGKIEDSCILVDTQSSSNVKMQCEESDGMRNDGEAEKIVELCQKFIENGVKPHEIGVMSAYRRQVDHIRSILKNESLEVNTIDSFQGREKRVIIWSLTWTKNSTKKSELLREERRINVALTRSQHKLVIIGCKESMETIPVLFRLSQMLTDVTVVLE